MAKFYRDAEGNKVSIADGGRGPDDDQATVSATTAQFATKAELAAVRAELIALIGAGGGGSAPAPVVTPLPQDQGFSPATAIAVSGIGGMVGSNLPHPNTVDWAPYELPANTAAGLSHGVWFRYDCTSAGLAVIDTVGTTVQGNVAAAGTPEDPLARNDTLLRVLTLSGDPAALAVVFNDDDGGGAGNSRVEFQAVAGTTYFFLPTMYYPNTYTDDLHVNWSLP